MSLVPFVPKIGTGALARASVMVNESAGIKWLGIRSKATMAVGDAPCQSKAIYPVLSCLCCFWFFFRVLLA